MQSCPMVSAGIGSRVPKDGKIYRSSSLLHTAEQTPCIVNTLGFCRRARCRHTVLAMVLTGVILVPKDTWQGSKTLLVFTSWDGVVCGI